jgi:radical SAM family uncharacterized protein/radical SAM-linked protein
MTNHLLAVEKPARYTGGETGASVTGSEDVSFVLAFPDVYEVGMSHLGLQILYAVLKQQEWLSPERVYAPWPDREEQLRREHLPLTTLESGRSLAEMDIVGFTLQYELSYTNILNMLDLGGVPLRAADRDDHSPLVIGGGPCAYNPEPLAEFFDAFLLGDGEEAILEIAAVVREAKRAAVPRRDLVPQLAGIAGVYVPSLFDVRYDAEGQVAEIVPLLPEYRRVKRRFVADLTDAPYPVAPVVPLMKTIHDRVSMEIARGCTRGCRFCQAGYVYRPVRERSPEQLLDFIERTLRNTGYEEISLLSLSTGDYGCILPLLTELMRRYAEERVAVSLPSLRVGSLSQELVEEIRKVRKTGFTLAPEAGSERLRRVINKGITEEDLLRNAGEIYGAGWRLIKLYFMIGLPGETMADVAAMADLSRKVKLEGKRSGNPGEVNVSVGTFVPKPHTPFQWEPQIGHAEIKEKQWFLRDELKRKKLNFKWQDAHLTFLEGVFARGDRRLGAVLRKAQELGCRFDGWGERLAWQSWEAAFVAAGIDPLFYHRRRELDETLPWDHLDCGVTRQYLLQERERAFAESATEDCRQAACSGCGVCDFDTIRMRLVDTTTTQHALATTSPARPAAVAIGDEAAERVRFRFSKTGAMRFLSHLELLNIFIRAARRAGLPVRHSQGFHPHPKFSFASALSVGVESWAEYADLELSAVCGAEQVMAGFNAALPEGIKILEACTIPWKSPSLSGIISAARYRVELPAGLGIALHAAVERFLARDTFLYTRDAKGKGVTVDLRRELSQLAVVENGLELVTGRGKAREYLEAITGLDRETLLDARIMKTDVIFNSYIEVASHGK